MSWAAEAERALAAGRACVVVTVARARGSVPRGAGAKMTVTGEGIAGSVGGGKLEHEAIARARAMLAGGGSAAGTAEFALGPGLEQSCGGAVGLVFERLDPPVPRWLGRWTAAAEGTAPTVALTALARPHEKAFLGPADEAPEGPVALVAEALAGGVGAALWPGGRATPSHLVERVDSPRAALYLFGAGHVGRALVRVLDGLPFRVQWVDERAALLAVPVPANVTPRHAAEPAALVAEAAGGALFLVMTHSHALDYAICERVLARGDAAYLGMIGSATKRATFVHRMRARGLAEGTIARLRCPIGIAGVGGKSPPEIAIAVAAELLTIAAGSVARAAS